MQRVRDAVGGALFHNNELYYEVAKDTMKWTFRGGGIGRSFGSRDPHIKYHHFIFASPLPRAHFCTE